VLSGANYICPLCCYNQQSQSTYPLHTHIPNKFSFNQMFAKSFQKQLISSRFKTFHSTKHFTLSKGLSVLCPKSQPDAFPLLAVHNCLIHTYTAIWKPALHSKQHFSNKGSSTQFFKYHYFSNQDG
jgi:hypothetical protein